MATDRKFLFFASILALILSAASLKGADPAVVQPPPSQTHRFLDTKNLGLFSLDAVLMAADLATTRRALEVPGAREANPLMRSPGGAIAMKAGAFGAGMGIAYMLHKSGHHRAERIVPLILGVPSGLAAVHNAGIHP
jgi:hypothetical protein